MDDLSERVFRYANRFADKAERMGRGTQWPTVAMAARALKRKQADIDSAVSEYCGPGYCGLSYWDTTEYRNGRVPLGKHFVEAYY